MAIVEFLEKRCSITTVQRIFSSSTPHGMPGMICIACRNSGHSVHRIPHHTHMGGTIAQQTQSARGLDNYIACPQRESMHCVRYLNNFLRKWSPVKPL